MLLMIESRMHGGVCHVVRSYAEANNKYMDNHDENKEFSFLQYLDANNLSGYPMTGKLPVGGFKWVKNVSQIDEEFIKKFDENSDIGFFLKVNFECPEELHDLHSDLPFLPEKMEINRHSKLVCMLYDKKGYVAHIKNIKQALIHGLKLKKSRKAIAFYHEAWLKPYIDMNTELRKSAKNDFEKEFYKLMNNAVFSCSNMNVRKHRDIKLVIDDKKRCKLASKRNYHTTKQFSENFLAMEMKMKMNVSIYIGFTILEVSKTLMWKFFYDYLKPKYGDKIELCYTDTDSFILYIKTEDCYEDIANDIEEWLDTSNYETDRQLLIRNKNKRVLGKFKDELEGTIMTKFVGLHSKTYAYLIDDSEEKKRSKGVKKCVVKIELNFNQYIDLLMETKQSIIQSGHIFQIIHTEYSLWVVMDWEKQTHY